MGGKWGQCTLHMLACNHPPSSLPPHTHAVPHTLSWITSLGLEMKGSEMPASTDALHPFSGGASGFPLSLWKHRFLCVVVLHVWLRNALPFWQIFIYLQVLEWEGLDLVWRASGTRVGGISRMKWAFGLNVFSEGFIFFITFVVFWRFMELKLTPCFTSGGVDILQYISALSSRRQLEWLTISKSITAKCS